MLWVSCVEGNFRKWKCVNPENQGITKNLNCLTKIIIPSYYQGSFVTWKKLSLPDTYLKRLSLLPPMGSLICAAPPCMTASVRRSIISCLSTSRGKNGLVLIADPDPDLSKSIILGLMDTECSRDGTVSRILPLLLLKPSFIRLLRASVSGTMNSPCVINRFLASESRWMAISRLWKPILRRPGMSV